MATYCGTITKHLGRGMVNIHDEPIPLDFKTCQSIHDVLKFSGFQTTNTKIEASNISNMFHSTKGQGAPHPKNIG